MKAGSSSGATRVRRHRRLQQLVGRQRRRRRRPPTARRRRGRAGRRRRRAGLDRCGLPWRPSRAALPSGLTAGTGFGGGTGFFGGTDRRPEAGRRHRERGRPAASDAFEVDGYASGLRRLEPLLDGVDRRLVAAHLPQRPVDVGDGLLAGKPHPGGHQRVDRRVAGGALQRRQSAWTYPGGAAAGLAFASSKCVADRLDRASWLGHLG